MYFIELFTYIIFFLNNYFGICPHFHMPKKGTDNIAI